MDKAAIEACTRFADRMRFTTPKPHEGDMQLLWEHIHAIWTVLEADQRNQQEAQETEQDQN